MCILCAISPTPLFESSFLQHNMKFNQLILMWLNTFQPLQYLMQYQMSITKFFPGNLFPFIFGQTINGKFNYIFQCKGEEEKNDRNEMNLKPHRNRIDLKAICEWKTWPLIFAHPDRWKLNWTFIKRTFHLHSNEFVLVVIRITKRT